jgi:hypothetical protein
LKLFCCTQHKRQFRRDRNSKKKLECPTCKVSFTSHQKNQFFCSKKCASLSADNKRYKEDVEFRLAKIIRSRLYAAIFDKRYKSGTIKYLGCSIEEFKLYLESKFEPWMTWDNYGRYSKNILTWQIDHILPLDKFNLTKESELKLACHYTNLQPLNSLDNIVKSNH